MGRASKDKRDIFYRLAKEEGWRARSAYKLIHINQTFNIFENVTRAVDLCAAPGSWSQVLSQNLPKSDDTHIIAVDLQSMAPIPGVVCLKADITLESTANQIISHLGNSKAQLVICDGAPDVIGLHSFDEYVQSMLVLSALNIAMAVLEPNGTFIAKFFRASAQGVRSMYLRFKVFFQDVVLTKPRSSRASSIECFIVARKFQIPEAFKPEPYYPFRRYDELIDPVALEKAMEYPWDPHLLPRDPKEFLEKKSESTDGILPEDHKIFPQKAPGSSKGDILRNQMAGMSMEDPNRKSGMATPSKPSRVKVYPCNPPVQILGPLGGNEGVTTGYTFPETPDGPILRPDGSVVTKDNYTNLYEFRALGLDIIDHREDARIWHEFLRDHHPDILASNKPVPPGIYPPNLRKSVEFFIKLDPEAGQKANQNSPFPFVPFVTSGDLDDFDSDTTYPTPEGYVSLPPVQAPITPAYAEAVERRKRNVEKGKKREQYYVRYFATTKIQLTFGGGAEKLVGNIKEKLVNVTLERSEKLTLTVLMDWIKKNLVVERPELLFLDGDVRPGILVLVNDMDYELLDDGINHLLSSMDKVSFISTLHGG